MSSREKELIGSDCTRPSKKAANVEFGENNLPGQHLGAGISRQH